MAIDNAALIAAIEAAKENSYGSDEHSDLGKKRAKAIEYYLGLNTNPAPEGRSQVVDRSVYETISTKIPSLVRIFAGSSDEVCKCLAVGPDDEESAEQQTAALNYVVTALNQWEQIVGDWALDAKLMCNGYVMAYWDESKRSIRETYEGQSEDQMAMLLSDTDIKVLEHSEHVDEQSTAEAQQHYQQTMMQWQQAAMQAQQTGQMPPPPPEQPQPVVLHDLVIERTENEGKVCIRVLPPEHCNVSSDTPNWTLRDCPYFEYREEKPIADLRAMGLDVPLDISDDEESDATDEDKARDRLGEDDTDDAKGVMRRVWARMIWIRADAEGDGESRMYYVLAVGKNILYAEPVSRVQVASLTFQPMPHRHIGLSEAETVFDVQDIRTAVTRGGLDNLYLANNGRHVISGKVNLADFLDSRPGGVVRMLDDSMPAEGHVLPLTHPFVFDQIIGSLEYFDQVRQNRTGASRYFSGTDAGAINKTASGTMALQNMASMRVEHEARVAAPAVEDLFSIVQEIMAKHANKAMTIKLRGGKWVTIDPQAWKTKRDIRISVGVGAGNKDSMMQQLMMTFQAQMQTMPLGLAGPEQMHASVIEMSKLAGFSNPDKFWIDPSKSPPPPPQPSPEMVKAQADQQKTAAQLQHDAQIKQMEAQMEQMRMQFDASEKEKDRFLQAELAKLKEATTLAIAEMNRQDQKEALVQGQAFEAAKMDFTAQREDSMKQQEQAKEQEKDDGMSELLSSVQEAIAALSQKMEASRTVGAQKVRDASGRVIGAKIMHADGTSRDVAIQ